MNKNFIKEKAIFQIFLVITLVFFTANIISKDAKAETQTSAQTGGCCADAGNGQYCQNVDSSSQCASGFTAGVSCDAVSQCGNKGCCNKLADDGLCSSNVPESSCEAQNGIWSSDPLCGSDLECQPKCCIIGDEWRLDYKMNCDYYNGVFLDSITSAGDCASQITDVKEGCCKYNNDEDFKFTTGSDCNSLEGIFFENTLCTNVAGYSDSNYESHKEAKCGPEGTSKISDVYWYDSAGNLEEKKSDCNPDSLQSATQCGDSDNDGKYTCESLDCLDTWDNPAVDNDGGSRKNGESWCEYQAAVGPGLDLPGTQHFRHKCELGKEIVEECASDRSAICMQGVVDYSGSKLSWAKCIENPGEDCLSFVDEDECTKNRCLWADSKCLPISPPGNFMSDDANDYCGGVNMQLKTAWQKKCGGSWRCVGNCEAYTDDSLKKFNNLCNTLGDCGAKYNLAGVYSNAGAIRSGSNCDSNTPTKITGGGNPPCYNNPPESYYDWNSLKNAGVGLLLGETSADDLDSSGSLSGRQLIAMTLNIFGNEKYLGEAIGGSGGPGSMGVWGMLGFGALAAVGAGAIVGIAIGAAILATSLEAVAKVGTAIGCAATGPMIALCIIIVTLVLLLISYLMYKVLPKLIGCPKTDEKTVNFNCGVWEIPKGGDDCEKCQKKISDGGLLPDYNFSNDDSYVCSEELCKSLGTWCEYDTAAYKCLKIEPDDLFAPSISIDKSATKYYCNKELPGDVTQCNEDANQGVHIITESGKEKGAEIKGEIMDIYEAAVKEKTPIITLGIKTDEESICKYDISNKPYNEMGYSFSAEDYENIRSTQHSITLPNDNIILTDSCGEYNLYVQCEDFQGNSGNLLEGQSYAIKFKVAKQPDLSPVIINENKINPLSGSYVKYADKEKEIEIKLDEPAQCKWDKMENVNYEDMANEFSCSGATIILTNETPQADLTQEDLEGVTDKDMCEPTVSLTCGTALNNISAGENRFYFKCMDAAGNVNTQDWPQIGIQKGYVLFGSSGNLTISEANCIHTLPDGESKTECGDIYAFNYTLRIKTEGGMDGNADCKYGFNTAPSIPFFSTGSKEHTQEFAPVGGLIEGSQTINVECEDKAGNMANKQITNNIKADRIAPLMERIYLDGSYLTLETNEKSTCKFANVLIFNYDTATEMASADGLTHKTVADKDYYNLGCKDIFGNSMSSISVTLLGKDINVG